MNTLKKLLVELLFPSSCLNCNIDSAYQLCDDCSARLLSSYCVKCQSYHQGQFCKRCATEMAISGLRVLAPYSLIKPWIYCHKLDLNQKVELMDEKLFELFFINLENSINKPFSVQLVPSQGRENWIQQILPHGIKNRIECSVFNRVEGQISQKYLNREERNSRRSDLFELRPDVSVTTDTVMLIDDVMSTGTSLECCISILLGLGYKEVYVVVFAYQSMLS